MTTLKAPNGIVTILSTPKGWSDIIQLYKGVDQTAYIILYTPPNEQELIAKIHVEGYCYEFNLKNARNWFKNMVSLGYKWEKISN